MRGNFLNHIVNEKNAKALWNKLETLCASKTCNNKLILLKHMIHLVFNEGSSIVDHPNEFQGCFDQLIGTRMKFDDEILALWLLNTLPNS